MVEHLELLVEEPSMEVTLRLVVPRIVPGTSFAVRTFNGKPDLLENLPSRLEGYRDWSASGSLGVVVVVDRDDDDCRALLRRLDDMAHAAALAPASVSRRTPGGILNRIAIEELQAWFLGDVAAMCAAFPGVPTSLRARRSFRDPDAVGGGTAEAFERVLNAAGHHRGGLRKMAAAASIAPHPNVEANDSTSFQKFRDGLRLVTTGTH